MKWKIIIKLLYLIILFAVASYKWEQESQLIDSDPNLNTPNTLQAYHEA